MLAAGDFGMCFDDDGEESMSEKSRSFWKKTFAKNLMSDDDDSVKINQC
jgi:hypothetical protein